MLFLPLFSPVFVFEFEFVYYFKRKQKKPSGGNVVLPSLLPVFVVLLLGRGEGLQNAGYSYKYIIEAVKRRFTPKIGLFVSDLIFQDNVCKRFISIGHPFTEGMPKKS